MTACIGASNRYCRTAQLAPMLRRRNDAPVGSRQILMFVGRFVRSLWPGASNLLSVG
jgi:hypothetical protein